MWSVSEPEYENVETTTEEFRGNYSHVSHGRIFQCKHWKNLIKSVTIRVNTVVKFFFYLIDVYAIYPSCITFFLYMNN